MWLGKSLNFTVLCIDARVLSLSPSSLPPQFYSTASSSRWSEVIPATTDVDNIGNEAWTSVGDDSASN